MSKRVKGNCLCSAIEFEVSLPEDKVHVCHCSICQKWHGGPALAVACESDWAIDGEDNMAWFDSSEWGQRSFCKKCGTHLFFRTKDNSYFGVTAGALENSDNFEIESHIFIDKKPPYYDFTGDAPRMTEQEFLEMVGSA